MTLVVVRSLRDFMVWWGGSLLTAGIISLIFASILVPTAKWAISTYMPEDLGSLISMPEFLVQIGFTDLFSELLNQLLMSIMIPAGTLTAIGFALLLGAYLLSLNTPNKRPQPINSSDQVITDSPG
jgi:Na+/H+-dicarboxylate symporter